MPAPHAPAGAAARRYDAWFDTGWGARAWPIEASSVLAALGPVNGRRVLDVGCGTGRLAALAAAAGATVVGVDVNPGMLTVAAARIPGRVVRGDATRLPFADDSLDAAVTLATLEFTGDASAVLGEMARVVRPAGTVVAAVLNPRSPWGLLDRPGRRAPYRDGCFLPAGELLRLAARHGAVAHRGALFSAPQLPVPVPVAATVEGAGQRLLPSFGAMQIVIVRMTG